MIAQDRPLCIFDLEATGVNVAEDRIVEISILRREVDGNSSAFTKLVNPERPIPPDATEVHHISNEMVQGAPTFKEIAPEVVRMLDGADLAGYNILSFDIPLLAAELKRAGALTGPTSRRMIDAYQIFKRREPHDLSTAVRHYLGRELDGAHRADADVAATLAVLDAQVDHYADLPKDVAGVDAWLKQKDPKHVDQEGKFKWAGEEAICAFGKNTGKSLRALARSDRGFLEWMLGKTFPKDTLEIVRRALAGEFPKREQTST
jgi:DNA polymerase-3 subunit epsilon